MADIREQGTGGLDAFAGAIEAAYHRELYWPGVYPLYNRMRRSDPEVSIVRQLWASLAASQSLQYELPHQERATDADRAGIDFLNELLDDVDANGYLPEIVSYVPFMGWGWWELVGGIRDPQWRGPRGNKWRSTYDDGRVGLRDIAFRDHSSLWRWELDERTGRLDGMVQYDHPNPPITIDIERSAHLTYGDNNNPEGLGLLEPLWRLERYAYNLQIIQGIGFEHAAGHAVFNVSDNLTGDDKTLIARAARAMLSAQEGNYIALPNHIDAAIMDIGFQAAGDLLEATKYYAVLKLSVMGAQWVAFSTLSGVGSLASMADASQMFVTTFNAMQDGFAKQLGNQIARWAQRNNPTLAFTQRPQLTVTPVEKDVELGELATFVRDVLPLLRPGTDDIIAVRRKAGFLPETLPDEDDEVDIDVVEQETTTDDSVDDTPAEPEPVATDDDDEGADAQMAQKHNRLAAERFVPAGTVRPEQPDPVDADELAADVDVLLDRLEAWAQRQGLAIDQLLDADDDTTLE